MKSDHGIHEAVSDQDIDNPDHAQTHLDVTAASTAEIDTIDHTSSISRGQFQNLTTKII